MLKETYKKAMDIVYVNFLWIITSLFGILITLGAATSAMFRVMHKITEEEGPTSIWKEFWLGVKKDFWMNTLVWIAIVTLFLPLYFLYLYALANEQSIFLVICVAGFYQLLIFFIFYFPTAALFETSSPWQMIRNVLIMSNTNIWTNIKVIGALVFVLILVFYVHPAFLVIGVGIYGFLLHHQLKKPFTPYWNQFRHNEPQKEQL